MTEFERAVLMALQTHTVFLSKILECVKFAQWIQLIILGAIIGAILGK